MDVEDVEVTGKLPSRVTRFAPKSSRPKPKPKPQSQPNQQQPKLEPQPPPPLSKPEPHELAAKKEDIDEPTTHRKSEPNGTAKTEFVPKSEAQDVTEQDDPMDLDLPGETSEDTVVREIDVFLAPSIDAATQ
ncbi:hypothetical protein PIB30_104353, partial [Stylosanthes scabra]|nr:hypothetical protein [Stylosanthes scabra]